MSARRFFRLLTVPLAGTVFWAGPAPAATVTATEGDYPSDPVPAVSATDLADTGQPTLLKLNVNNDPDFPDPGNRWSYPNDWNSGSYTRLNNGSNWDGGYNPAWASSHHDPGDTTPAFQMYTFDTTVNAYGYDISSIVTTSLDRDGRSWQQYTLAYHIVGDPADTWTDVVGDGGEGSYTVLRPAGGGPRNEGEYYWRQVTITFARGELTEVDKVRFTTPRYADGHKGCTSWAEIDVFGAPSLDSKGTLFVFR